MIRKKSERMVKFVQVLAVIIAVAGLGLVANPSNYANLLNGLGTNQIAWIGLGLIILGIYTFKKSG